MSEPFIEKNSAGGFESYILSGLINHWVDAASEQIAPGESRIRSRNLPPESTGNPTFYHLKDNLTYRLPRRIIWYLNYIHSNREKILDDILR